MIYPDEGVTDAHPLWEPEFFGDVPVVNGKAYPFVDVEPRRYRLRIVNGSQARFYNLKFASERGNAELPFHLIGTEGGLLRAPVELTKLLIAPGERVDVIVDFAAGERGTQWLLKNDARAPFPSGEHGDVTQLVQFRVARAAHAAETTTPADRIDLPALDRLPAPTQRRTQHLRELLDAGGDPIMLQVEDLAFLDPVTTMPAAGSTEDWLLVNTTADTHPIHLHLVHFEVIDRRPFNAAAYLAGQGIVYTGSAVPAPPTEDGRKDTVKAHPGEVTTIRATFDLPTYGPIELPEGTSHPQYVWHCHILEHEENDMMRPFEVV
jgi:spore coat protein A